MRCHPAPEAPSNSIGLEAIIRKALMGNYDEQSEERAAQAGPGGASAGAALDGRPEDFFSQGARRSPSPPILSQTFALGAAAVERGGGLWKVLTCVPCRCREVLQEQRRL